jgi:hypothetical protein
MAPNGQTQREFEAAGGFAPLTLEPLTLEQVHLVLMSKTVNMGLAHVRQEIPDKSPV